MPESSQISSLSSRRRLRRHWPAAKLVAKAAKRELHRLRADGKVTRRAAAELPALTTDASSADRPTIGQTSVQRNRVDQILQLVRDRCHPSGKPPCHATIIVPGKTRLSHASNMLQETAHTLTLTRSQKDMFIGSHLRRGKEKATKRDRDQGK